MAKYYIDLLPLEEDLILPLHKESSIEHLDEEIHMRMKEFEMDPSIEERREKRREEKKGHDGIRDLQ